MLWTARNILMWQKIRLEITDRFKWTEGYYIWNAYTSPLALILKGLLILKLFDQRRWTSHPENCTYIWISHVTSGTVWTTQATHRLTVDLAEVHGLGLATPAAGTLNYFLGKKMSSTISWSTCSPYSQQNSSTIFSEKQSTRLASMELVNKQLGLVKGKRTYNPNSSPLINVQTIPQEEKREYSNMRPYKDSPDRVMFKLRGHEEKEGF